jgi:hypothetical protein
MNYGKKARSKAAPATRHWARQHTQRADGIMAVAIRRSSVAALSLRRS